jgi:hypothetical protein
MERIPRSEWAPNEGDLRTTFLKQGGIRALKLALGRVIENECGSGGPGDYRELYADSLLLVALPRELADALRSEMDTLRHDVSEACDTHGRMRGRTFRLEFAAPHGGDEILVTSGPGWAAALEQEDMARDSALTLQDVEAVTSQAQAEIGWQPGRWGLAVLDPSDGRPVKVYPLTDPITTAGRPSKRADFSTSIAIEGAPDFISRRQLAIEWKQRNRVRGFLIYNLGRPVITLMTEGAEQLPGAQVAAGPVKLAELDASFKLWVRPGTKFRIGHRGPLLTIVDLASSESDSEATAQEPSPLEPAAVDEERTKQEA